MGLDMFLIKKKRLSMTHPKIDWEKITNAPDAEKAYYESTKHEQVWEHQTVKQWSGEKTLHNYFCEYANYEIGPAPLRITESIATKLLDDINQVLEDNTRVKTIFPTKCSRFNNYGCDEYYYEEGENLESFIKMLTKLKPMVEQIIKDLNPNLDLDSDEVIIYEYDCWY